MGEGRRSPASPLRFQTSEGTLSLAAEEAQPPPDRRPGRSPLAVAALIGTSYAYLSSAEREVALGNSAGNYVLPTASAIQAGLKGLILLRFARVPGAIGRLILARSRR